MDLYERGERHIAANLLVEFSRALDVPVTQFFQGLQIKSEQAAPVAGWPYAPPEESRELVKAYIGIKDARMRKSIMQLACYYAADQA
jgi:hypothetical protein